MAENEQKETTETKTAPAAKVKKPAREPRRAGDRPHQASKKNAPFSDSLADRFGNALANKLKRGIEDDIKRKIKAAQSDPAVQRASAKFGK